MSSNESPDEEVNVTGEVSERLKSLAVAPIRASAASSSSRTSSTARSRSVDAGSSFKPSSEASINGSHNMRAGVWFWQDVVSEVSVGNSRLLMKLLRFAIPNTFIIDPKQSVTGLIFRNNRIEVVMDMPPDSILRFMNSDELHNTQSPVAVLKQPVGEVGTSVTVLDQATFGQVVRRIHDSDESNILCIQEYVSASQIVRVTFSAHGSPFTGLVISSTSPRVFKLSGSALDSDLRHIAKSVAQLIEGVFRVHISNVVVDCVKSSTWRLLQVKSILVDRPATTISAISTTMVSCTSRCGICREAEVSKMVTPRMISECRKNLCERYPKTSALVSRLNSIKTSLKCCDECYTLIMNELELVNISKSFIKFISWPNSVSVSSEFWRLGISVHGFSNYPPAFISSGIRITCGDGIAVVIADPPKMTVWDLADTFNLTSELIRVSVDGYSGSVDCLDSLAARARMNPGTACTYKTNVFLGKDTFALSISVGLVWYKGPITCGKFTPIPDDWLKGRRQRSHSNSKRLFVRS